MKKWIPVLFSSALAVLLLCGSASAESSHFEDLAQTPAEASLSQDSEAQLSAGIGGAMGQNLKWTLENGVLTISGQGAMRDVDWSEMEKLWHAYSDQITSVQIQPGVTSIGARAFRHCTNLTSVTIPDGVTSIGEEAFYYTSLTSVTIPDGVTHINWNTFEDCTSLTNVTIPDGVTSIGVRSFAGCTSLTSVTIPDSVRWIDNYAFYECGLTDVYFQGTQGQWAALDTTNHKISQFATIHYAAEIATATLTSGNQTVSFSYTDRGKLILAEGKIAQNEVVLVGCYNTDGRFVGVKMLDATHKTVPIDPDTPNVKLFWLGANQNPLSPSATVWGK